MSFQSLELHKLEIVNISLYNFVNKLGGLRFRNLGCICSQGMKWNPFIAIRLSNFSRYYCDCFASCGMLYILVSCLLLHYRALHHWFLDVWSPMLIRFYQASIAIRYCLRILWACVYSIGSHLSFDRHFLTAGSHFTTIERKGGYYGTGCRS